MRIDELVGTPADQQGSASGVGSLPPLSNSGAQMAQQASKMNDQQAGVVGQKTPGNVQPPADPNSPQAQKAKQQQKKQIQAQIKSTQQQLKQLQTQLREI